ncbi:putative Ig domain-containing protein [Vacuolonema iberomarrocanum]|uniref:putative Ig domain-containing protein n=1 Tax=Vacuolonema iberomarrocanum TaxID=3454632 RepID=UPI0019FEFBB0|nr:hypothetical protein [filamentous cyanobacterium LEGE 07170]
MNAQHAFQVLDLDTASSLTFNDIVNVTVPRAEAVAYSFSVASEERVWMDNILGHPLVAAQLFDGAGRPLVASQDSRFDNGPLSLQAGQYYLVFSSRTSTPVDMAFRLLNLGTSSEAIAPGQPITVAFDPKNSARAFTFNGTTGERLYLDAKTPSGYGSWALYTPDGQRLNSPGQSLRDFELDLPVTGEYLMVLNSEERYGPATFSFELFSPVSPTVAIETGQIIHGSLATFGQQNHYTIEVEYGQHLYFNSLKAASGNLDWTLVSPSGNIEFNSDFRSNQRQLFSEPGTYTLMVDGVQDHLENYHFQILDLDDVDQVPMIQLDEGITNGFDASEKETSLYRFSGEEDQYVYFNRLEGGYDSFWILRDQTGTELASNRLSYDFEQPLPYSGDYFLELQGNNASARYAFELVTPEWATQVLTLGQVVSGELTEAGERQFHTFEGTPGQILYFDSLKAASSYLDWRLISPTGETLFNSDFSSDQLQTLEEDGRYTLIVDGYNDHLEDYQFQVWDWANPAHAQPITLDSLIRGDFGVTGRASDFYRFSAQAGDYLYFDSFLNSGIYESWTLYSSSGEVLVAERLSDDFELALPYTGDYIIRGFGAGGTNDYEFEVVTPQLTTEALSFDSVITGEIAESGDQRAYTFDGNVGQRLYFDSLQDSSLYWRLLAPSGKEVFANSPTSGRSLFNDQLQTLSEAGQYTLVIDGRDNDTGTFRFQVKDWSDQQSVTPIEFDTPINGMFDGSQRDAVFYRFTGQAGTDVYFDWDADGAPNWTLYDAAGNQLRNSNSDFELALPRTGDYVLGVFGSRSVSDYGFQLVTPEVLTRALSLGEVVSGALTEAGEQHTYVFHGSVGQQLYFDRNQASSTDLVARLYDPYGNEIFSRYFYDNPHRTDVAFTLMEAGDYRLVIDGEQDSTAVGTYQFHLSDRGEAPQLPIDLPTSGTLDARQTQLYQFNGERGQVISFDWITQPSGALNWVLYDASNQAIAQPDWRSPDFSAALPTSGRYTLAVMNSSDSPADYEFSVSDTSPAPVVNTGLGVVQQGALAAGETVEYQFTASAGTQVLYDSLNQSNGQIRTRLINPDGSYAFDYHNASVDRDPFVLQQSGDYTLQVYGIAASTAGTYEFTLHELPSSVTSAIANGVEPGTIVTGSLSGKEDIVYSFEGIAGRRMLFNGMDGSNVKAQLYDPNGQRIFSLGNVRANDSDPFTLEVDGTYHLVIEGEQSSGRTYQFQLLDLEAGAPIPFNVPVSGVLEPGSANALHHFSGEAGQRLFFRAIEGSWSHEWQLIGPDGQTIGTTHRLDRDFEATLPHSGDYRIRVLGRSPQTESVSYRFEVLTPSIDNTVSIITPGTGESASNNEDASLGLFPVTLQVEDGRGGTDIQEFNIRLWPDPDNADPVIISTPSSEVALDQKGYSYQVTALDADNDELQYRLLDGPLGALMNQSTGELLWFAEPDVQAGDIVEFTIEAIDGRGGTSTQTFSVEVFDALGSIAGIVFEDLNRNGIPDSTLIQGEKPDVFFVIDTSSSMLGHYVDWTHADLNTVFNQPMTPYDQELGAFIVLNNYLANLGYGDDAQVGIVNSGQVRFDMNPVEPGVQFFTTPLADHNNNGILDVREAVNGDFGGGFSNTSGLALAWGIQQAAGSDANIIFMSDGFITVDTQLIADMKADGVNIQAFGSAEGGMETMRLVDEDALYVGSPADIVDIFSGFDSRYMLEPLMEDVTVYLDLNDNGVLDADEPFQVTGELSQDITSSGTRFQFRFDNLLPGDYTLRQVIPNGYEQTAPEDTVIDTVTVGGGENFVHLFGNHLIEAVPNQAPTFISDSPTGDVVPNTPFSHRIVATDPDADRLTYDVPLGPEGLAVDPETGTMVWVPSPNQVGTHDVIVRVRDGEGGVDLQAFKVTVAEPNQAPTFSSVLSDQVQPQVGKTFTYDADALDLDGDDLTYSLVDAPDGAEITSDTGILTWTPTATGDAEIVLKVMDAKGGEDFQILNLTVIDPLPNRSPSITSTTPRTEIRYGQPYFHQFEAVDPDGDALTYALVNAPAGMTLSEDGFLSWIPSVAQSGAHAVEVQIGDGNGSATPIAWTLNVSHQSTNHAPIITSVPETRTNLEKGFTYDAQGSDVDGDTLLWSLEAAPEGMGIDPLSGQVSWNPEPHQIGTHTVQIQVMDPFGLFTGQAFEVVVTGANTPPAIVSEALTQATTDAPYRYDVVAVDPEQDALHFSLGVRPDGMSIDAESGVIRWTPHHSQVGYHEVEVLVQDAQGGLNRQRFTVDVGTEAMNQAPSIESSPVFRADVGSPYRYSVEASDPDVGDVLSYQLIEAPAGMTIDSTGEIQWDTPVFGNHKVVVNVTDDQGLGAAQGFTLTVLENSAPVIRSTAKEVAQLGEIYQYDVVAIDPDNQALTYRLDADSVARGMTIDGLGRLRWTPTDDQVAADLPVTVTVTDELGATTEQSFTVSVMSDDQAPLVSLRPSLDPLYVGQDLTLYVWATDNIEVTNLQVLINGEAVALNQGQVTIAQPPAGAIAATVIATDAAGNSTTESISIDVLDLSDGTAPVIELPTLDGVVTSPIEIRGTVTDDNLASYTLSVAPVGTEDFRVIFTGTEPVTDGVLGTFDPTVLANDAYTMRLTATDTAGNTVLVENPVNVGGALKLGNFTLSFTDLGIPLSGIPISVTRTYDSLNANTTDDFGYGWRLEFRDTDLRTSLGRDEQFEQLGIRSQAFDEETRVYVTLPGGQRQGFTFAPKRAPISQFLPSVDGADTGFYEPAFEADPGVTSTLSVKYSGYLSRRPDNTFGGLQGSGFNPEDSLFGGVYVLTTQAGIVYEIDATTGDLLTATDTNNNQLTFSDEGIFSDTGVQVTFNRDAQGRIREVMGPEDALVTYSYDENGDLISVTDPENYTTQFDYHDEYDHYLDEIIDPLGRTAARSEYNDEGRLETLFDANGNPVTITYDPDNSTQVVTDANGNDTFYEYDSRGNVVQQVDASGAKTLMKYEDPRHPFLVTQVIDDNGQVTTYTYDANGHLTARIENDCGCANVPSGTTYYTHNARGQMTAIVLPTGASFSQDYDERGNLLAIKDGDGNLIQSYTYDRRGNVLTESDPFGSTSYDNPDTPGTTHDFDAFGNPYWMQDANGEITTMTYNDRGLLETMTDDEGTSTFTYDQRGRETRADYGDGIFVEYSYGYEGDWTTLNAPTIGRIERKFTADGKLGGWVTPDGGELTFTYDKVGRLETETTPDGQVTRYEYDDVNRTHRVINEATGLVSETVYDNVGRVQTRTQIADEGTVDERRYTTRYTYDSDGRVKTMTDPRQKTWTYEYVGLATTVIDPLGRRTTTVQTENYLPDEVRYADGSTSQTEFLFNNNLLEGSDYPTRVVGQGDHDRVFTYDDFGRLATATDLGDNTFYYHYRPEDASDTTAINAFEAKYDFSNPQAIDFFVENAEGDTLLAYDYDSSGNLVAITYEDGRQRQFDYGTDDETFTIENPDGTSSTYNSSDNRLETMTLPSGIEVRYTYNAAGQEELRQYYGADGITLIETVDTEWTADGKLKSITDNSGITTYHYNLVTGALSGMDSPTGSLRYDYDSFGRIAEMGVKASPDAEESITQYRYDGNSNLIRVIDSNGETEMVYDDVNRLQTRILPNSVTMTYVYQANTDWVESITHNDKDGTVLSAVQYERNPDGTPHTITREDGTYVKLDYDDSLRLETETYYSAGGVIVDEIAYTYDPDGNRHTVSNGVAEGTYHYDTTTHQLSGITTAAGDESYLYDESGRVWKILRDGETLTLNYNANDQLETITNAEGEVVTAYSYDSQGRRLAVDDKDYLVAPMVGTDLNSPHLITDSNGDILSRYVYAGATPLMRFDENGAPIYYLTDAMGSVIGLVDNSGASAATFHYDSFGNLRTATGNAATELNATGGDFRFQSQWLESDTDLYHFRARYYDPEVGRFISRDPVDIIQTAPESSNPYQFVYNNPFIYTDPTGELTLTSVQSTQQIQNILQRTQSVVARKAYEQAIDAAQGVVGDLLYTALNSIAPPFFDGLGPIARGNDFEDLAVDNICSLFGAVAAPIYDRLWLGVPVHTGSGIPQGSGIGCPPLGGVPRGFPGRNQARPDFIFKKGSPTEARPKAWLIGDIAFSVRTVEDKVHPNKPQWNAIYKHAQYQSDRQYTPLVLYMTFRGGTEAQLRSIQEEATSKHVIAYILSVFD